jgi:hypothetical protein
VQGFVLDQNIGVADLAFDVAASGRINGQADADAQIVIAVEERFQDHRQVADVAAVHVGVAEGAVEAAVEGHSHLDRSPPIHVGFLEADRVAVDRVFQDGCASRGNLRFFGERQDIVIVVVAGKDAIDWQRHIVLGKLAGPPGTAEGNIGHAADDSGRAAVRISWH